MLLDLIGEYYKYLWLLLAAFILLKIIVSFGFHNGINRMGLVLFSIFKWYTQDDKDMEEEPGQRSVMVFLNVVTVIILVILSVIFAAGLLLALLRK